MIHQPCIHVVDDDPAVRDSLQVLLEAQGYEVVTYTSGLELLAAGAKLARGCIVMDVRMPGLDGLTVQERLSRDRADLPVLLMTGEGDIPLAVKALKAGAHDFLEKPFEPEMLLASVRTAMHDQRDKAGEAEHAATLVEQLTPREREVLERLAAGEPNKAIARHLGISPRTVEIHRARIMGKLAARGLADAIRLAVAAGVGAASA